MLQLFSDWSHPHSFGGETLAGGTVPSTTRFCLVTLENKEDIMTVLLLLSLPSHLLFVFYP